MPDQISMRELLQDPILKEWMRKIPKLTPTPRTTPPWILYARTETRWSRREFETYPQAFNALARLLKEVDDAAIHSKRQEFRPPVVRKDGRRYYWPQPPGHRWCGYCRRPTIFRCFQKHHAMKLIVNYEPRCTVCGIKGSAVKTFSTPLRSKFA